ncbi:molybdopterin molybdotransferase MoeA [Catenovulum adriaticum]|uniref:Molybdopterin molybdenumtransferase n=1 Tax=Catenovulum adriaticum TaxID=2984846 RepID=A0ABY7AL71_9ALTE|nr:gephyrin-like molybdotransferase Glp [Catenovulum sp. TS8]WAJ69406.1 molybdopterin molybdotransferase MoeA [Catenovulum sp. TS8]
MIHCDSQPLLPLEDALTQMLTLTKPIKRNLTKTISESQGCILAEDIVSPINVPPYDNSAMDGYAIAIKPDTLKYKVVGKALAGQPYQHKIVPGECIRIMTGAVIPEGANTVVMQENAKRLEQHIELSEIAPANQNIRLMGDDIQQGHKVLAKGQLLRAVDIGLLASLGIAQVSVFEPIKVGVFTTGDELKQPGELLSAGQIYDSNRPMLKALLNHAYIQVVDLGVIADDFSAIEQAFITLSNRCDAIVSCGGVSVGDADYTKQVIDKIGEINFWKLAIKPGKPFAFGKINQALFLGLPGNPVSSYVTFEQLVKPALSHLAGQQPEPKVRLSLPVSGTLRKRPGRKDFQRARLIRKNNIVVAVEPAGKQSSGVLSSVAYADCYIVLEAEQGHVGDGEHVNVELFK